MEARNVTSPGKADGTESQPTFTLIPFTLLGAFGLEAIASAAALKPGEARYTPPSKGGAMEGHVRGR
jgi:hypothetical protein